MVEDSLEEFALPHPSELMAVIRQLEPEFCYSLDTLAAFQKYIWSDRTLKEIRVHPRQEAKARLYCSPPGHLMCSEVLNPPAFVLFIDHAMPEYEMCLVFADGKRKTINLD